MFCISYIHIDVYFYTNIQICIIQIYKYTIYKFLQIFLLAVKINWNLFLKDNTLKKLICTKIT